MTKYAQGTTLSSDKSRTEIEATLRRYGATSLMYRPAPDRALIAFEAFQRRVNSNCLCRIRRPRSSCARQVGTTFAARRMPPRRTIRLYARNGAHWPSASRPSLRPSSPAITTVEAEFLAHIVLPNGRTVHDEVSPLLPSPTRPEDCPATGRVLSMDSATSHYPNLEDSSDTRIESACRLSATMSTYRFTYLFCDSTFKLSSRLCNAPFIHRIAAGKVRQFLDESVGEVAYVGRAFLDRHRSLPTCVACFAGCDVGSGSMDDCRHRDLQIGEADQTIVVQLFVDQSRSAQQLRGRLGVTSKRNPSSSLLVLMIYVIEKTLHVSQKRLNHDFYPHSELCLSRGLLHVFLSRLQIHANYNRSCGGEGTYYRSEYGHGVVWQCPSSRITASDPDRNTSSKRKRQVGMPAEQPNKPAPTIGGCHA